MTETEQDIWPVSHLFFPEPDEKREMNESLRTELLPSRTFFHSIGNWRYSLRYWTNSVNRQDDQLAPFHLFMKELIFLLGPIQSFTFTVVKHKLSLIEPIERAKKLKWNFNSRKASIK